MMEPISLTGQLVLSKSSFALLIRMEVRYLQGGTPTYCLKLRINQQVLI